MIQRFHTALALALAFTAHAPAAAPPKAAVASAQQAADELAAMQRKYSDMRLSLYREVNSLDDQATALAKRLQQMSREEDTRSAAIRKTEKERDALKAELTYCSGVLSQ